MGYDRTEIDRGQRGLSPRGHRLVCRRLVPRLTAAGPAVRRGRGAFLAVLRDALLPNVRMLVRPIPAVKEWQMGAFSPCRALSDWEVQPVDRLHRLQRRDEGRRVGRPVGTVAVGMAGEVVLEGHRSTLHESA